MNPKLKMGISSVGEESAWFTKWPDGSMEKLS